ADAVALDDVAGAVAEPDPLRLVAADHIAGPGLIAAEDHAEGSLHEDAFALAGQASAAVRGGTDVVALNNHAFRQDVLNEDPALGVGGDHIEVGFARATDLDVAGVVDDDAPAVVADGLLAVGVGANVVGLDADARRTQIEQLYAVAAGAGNHVTQDIDGTSLREHSIPGIADRVAPGGVGADDVEADVGLTPTLHGDAIPQVAGDEIAEKLQRGNRGADPDVLRTAFHEDAKTVIAGRVIVGI